MPKAIQELTDLIAELPGLGPRQARRVVQFLIRVSPQFRERLIRGISSLPAQVTQCKRCLRYDQLSAGQLCAVCADTTREPILMVVEKDIDIEGVEAARVFHGTYFVLGSLFSLGKRKTEPRVEPLIQRIKAEGPALREVVVALSTTPEGDYTARELKTRLGDVYNPALKVTVLGRGLSLGAEIEYADQETLRSALQGRREEF